MQSKPKEKEIARNLRKKDYSIKEIAKKLKVSPGSVHLWVKDIPYNHELMKIKNRENAWHLQTSEVKS